MCAGCHKAIAATQANTAMAKTWHGTVTSSLPASFDASKSEGTDPVTTYNVRRRADHLDYSLSSPSGTKLTLPVSMIVGGKRHGLSFLERVERIDDIPLDRPALIEGRYAYNAAHKQLVLSPGFALEKPRTFEDAVGNVLSPVFEQRCLECHGKPDTLGAGKEGGVHCESCHGPGFGHLSAVGKGNPREGVLNPARLAGKEQMAVCAQCHTGFTYQSDPLPDDLLVSNQVNALSRAECFIQSGEKLTCTGCHDPHQDSPHIAEATTKTCLSCHGVAKTDRAAICPINASGECIGCHMPSVQKGSFHMTDHWIRVHPEQGLKASTHDAALRSRVQPIAEFLRLIVTADRQKADDALKSLADGKPFGKVAHDVSIDPTAPGGGYLGEMQLSQMDSRLAAAAAKLSYGENSQAINMGDRWIVLSRMPRDFKWQAGELFRQASDLRERGDLKGAIEKDQAALSVYPYFLRAMIFMATALGEAGDVGRATEILQFATQSYPKDSPARFNLGLTLGSQPAQQIEAFEKAIELDPDLVAGYESLGAALYAAGRADEAMETFRKGLLIDPLSAKLNFNLGLALRARGDSAEGERHIALAKKADPEIAREDQKGHKR